MAEDKGGKQFSPTIRRPPAAASFLSTREEMKDAYCIDRLVAKHMDLEHYGRDLTADRFQEETEGIWIRVARLIHILRQTRYFMSVIDQVQLVDPIMNDEKLKALFRKRGISIGEQWRGKHVQHSHPLNYHAFDGLQIYGRRIMEQLFQSEVFGKEIQVPNRHRCHDSRVSDEGPICQMQGVCYATKYCAHFVTGSLRVDCTGHLLTDTQIVHGQNICRMQLPTMLKIRAQGLRQTGMKQRAMALIVFEATAYFRLMNDSGIMIPPHTETYQPDLHFQRTLSSVPLTLDVFTWIHSLVMKTGIKCDSTKFEGQYKEREKVSKEEGMQRLLTAVYKMATNKMEPFVPNTRQVSEYFPKTNRVVMPQHHAHLKAICKQMGAEKKTEQ